MRLKDRIEQLAREKGAAAFLPENIEKYLADVAPEMLCKSETLQVACQVTDEEMEVFYGEAYRFYEEGRYTEAADAFRWLVLFNPFLFKYWMGLGASQQLLKLYEKALHSYAISSLLDTLSPYPHFYAYDCLMGLGDREDAAKALALALERARYDLKYVSLKNEIITLQEELCQV